MPSVKPTPFRSPGEVECWGHRGASAHLPENTLASFNAAIQEGADGIESDVHATSDGVILMFHDPTLDRTTNGTGAIKTQPWKGVIEHVRTKKEPIQPIPRFEELLDLIMQPENRHVTLNIDCKMQNDPEIMFPIMAKHISSHESWETTLAPRLILGLWHPLFIRSALTHLPLLRRFHIGLTPTIARQYFWSSCDGFSLRFPLLMGSDGQKFMKECREAGKEITVWTVNDVNETKIAMSWGIKAILTDHVAAYDKLRKEIIADPRKLALEGWSSWTLPWSQWQYYTLAHVGTPIFQRVYLKAHGRMTHIDNNPTSNDQTAFQPISPDSPLAKLPGE